MGKPATPPRQLDAFDLAELLAVVDLLQARMNRAEEDIIQIMAGNLIPNTDRDDEVTQATVALQQLKALSSRIRAAAAAAPDKKGSA
jgi:hypothetical protein